MVFQILIEHPGDYNQMTHYAASDLGLQSLHVSNKHDAMLIWGNQVISYYNFRGQPTQL